MSATTIEELFGLLALVALLAWGARAVGLPYPIVLVLGGVGLGFVPGLPSLHVAPDVIFLVFLPPLVHAAAYRTSPRRLRQDAPELAWLALGLVAATIGAVAAVAHATIPGLGWAPALALGTIVAPTDAVAATTVFRRVGAPQRLVGIVEGESLVNDGSALVAYRLAVTAVVAGAFSALEGVRDLVVVSVGGVAVGLAVAWLAGQARRRLDDSLIEITITLLTPYVAYIAAERAGVSGVLAAVTSGVTVGRLAPSLFSPGTRLQAMAFWTVLTFLLESTLFILLGLEFPGVVHSVPGSLVAAGLLVAAATITVRLLGALVLGRLALGERLVVGWAGMRGAVSLAAALALPTATQAGTPFPARDEILFVTLLVIGVTLVLQGLTLPLVVRAALPERPPERDARRQALARFQTVEAALGRIGELSLDGDVPASTVERARAMYTQRASQLAGECRTGVAEESSDTAAWLQLRLDLLGVERSALLDLRDRGDVPTQAVLDVERDLDLEESRLQARLARGVAA